MFTTKHSTTTRLRQRILRRIIPIVVLVIAAASLITFRGIVYQFHREVEVRVEANAINFAKTADSRLKESAHAVAAIAQNDVVIHGIIDLESREATAIPFFRSLVLPGPKEQVVVMTDYRGNPIALNRMSQDDKYRSLLTDLKNVWSTIVLKNEESFIGLHDEWLLISSPIRYSTQAEGAVVVIYRLEDFFGELLEDSKTTVQGFETNGRVFASSNAELLKPNHKEGAPNGWLESRTSIDCLPQIHAIVRESERTVTRASRTVILALGTFLAVWLVGIVLAIFLSSFMVTSPIAKLVERIKDVQKTGDLSLRVPENGPDEISKLSSAFNKMLAELNKTTVSKESYRKLALVAKYTDNAVVITNAQGKIEWTNDGFSRITGYSFDEVVGSTPGSMLQGELTDPDTIEIMRQAIADKKGFDVEIINYNKSGVPYWVAIETRPIFEDNGDIKFIAIETEISERKKNEEVKEKLSQELQDAARQAGMAEIATGVLHNVGNVLNSINVSTNWLIRSRRNSAFQALAKVNTLIHDQGNNLGDFFTNNPKGKLLPKYLDSLLGSLENEQELELKELNELAEHVSHVNEIISFQQSYAKRIGVTEAVNLAAAIEGVLKMNTDSFKANRIQVLRNFHDDITLNLNKHKFLQIAINLITNAKHAVVASNNEPREIQVTIEQAEGVATISVKDSGIGISAENMAKIFGHGFTTKKDGHGFGLHSSALAAKEMGGELSADSAGEGLGATFTITLPIIDNGHKATDEQNASRSTQSDLPNAEPI